MELIKEIGALAGIFAFLGLAVLSLLYFSQARDVRRLREWAGRAPERNAEEVDATSDLAAERAEEIRQVEEERRKREEAATADKQAAEHREKRRERRQAGLAELTWRERLREAVIGPPGARRRMPEPRYIAVVAGAVIVLGVGVAAAATQLLGGSSTRHHDKHHKATAVKRSQIEVAVLNGTNPAVNGLATLISNKLESEGFRTGAVGDSTNSFGQSVVMYALGHKPEAQQVAKGLGIQKLDLMTTDIRQRSAGATVAVVAGQDKANFTG